MNQAQPNDIAQWFDSMRMFASSKNDEHLLRFAVVQNTDSYTDVLKGYWLKYDPEKHPEKLASLNWLGMPICDGVLRKPKIPEDLTCHIWFICSTVREYKYSHGSYYNEDGDPFDPDNAANWDGDQQIGFRD